MSPALIDRVREALEVWDDARREALYAAPATDGDRAQRDVLVRLGAYASSTYENDAVDWANNPTSPMVRAGIPPDAAMPEVELRALVDAGPAARRLILRHPAVTPDVLYLLVPEQSDAVLDHPRATDELIACLAAHPDVRVRLALARRPTTPLTHLLALEADRSVDVYQAARQVLAARRDASPELLARLAADENVAVRIAVAANPSIPVDALAVLAEDRTYYVRAGAASNPRAGAELLTGLATDPMRVVRMALVRRSGLTAEIWTALADDSDEEVRWAVASARGAPTAVLEALAADRTHTVRAGVAENASAPIALVTRIARDAEPAVARRAQRVLDQIARRGR